MKNLNALFGYSPRRNWYLRGRFPVAETTSNPYLPPDLHPDPCHRRCRPDGHVVPWYHRGLDKARTLLDGDWGVVQRSVNFAIRVDNVKKRSGGDSSVVHNYV